MPIYYIPKLDILVLMVGTEYEEGGMTINVHADETYTKEIEKLTFSDITYIGEL